MTTKPPKLHQISFIIICNTLPQNTQIAQPPYTLCKPPKTCPFPSINLTNSLTWSSVHYEFILSYKEGRLEARGKKIKPAVTKQTFLGVGSFTEAQNTPSSVARIGIITHTS